MATCLTLTGDMTHVKKKKPKYPKIPWNEIVRLARPIEMGTTTSAIHMRYGCGHEVFVMNGDATYHTCPYCYITRIREL